MPGISRLRGVIQNGLLQSVFHRAAHREVNVSDDAGSQTRPTSVEDARGRRLTDPAYNAQGMRKAAAGCRGYMGEETRVRKHGHIGFCALRLRTQSLFQTADLRSCRSCGSW